MKKKISILLMVLVMVLSATVTSYAAVGDEVVSPRATSSISYTTNRTSNTTAYADVAVIFSSSVDQYSVVIYLQKYVNGTWVNDTTNDDYVFYNNGFGGSSFLFSHNYTDLTSGTNYRLMTVSRDVINGNETRVTKYSNPF